MALIPSLFFSILFVVIILIIIITATIIGKVGMSLLGKKLLFKNYGLLWVPLLGSWYDGKMVSYFLKSKSSLWSIVFLVLRVIPTLLYIILLIDINFTNHVPTPELQFADFVMFGLIGSLFAGEVTIRIAKMFAMLKGNCNGAIAVLISIFFPDFWSFCMLSKVKSVRIAQ